MSIGEILVVLIVAMVLVKPEDLPALRKSFIRIKKYFARLQSEIASWFDDPDDASEMNEYLEKISGLGEKYNGDYSLSEVKAKYLSLLKRK